MVGLASRFGDYIPGHPDREIGGKESVLPLKLLFPRTASVKNQGMNGTCSVIQKPYKVISIGSGPDCRGIFVNSVNVLVV